MSQAAPSRAVRPLSESPLVQAYLQRTPKSAALAKQAVEVFPSGITHDSRYLDPYPIFVERALGSRKWDVDGHELVDYSGGHGALLLGHSHPAVVEAVQKQAAVGTHFGACHELELEWGQWIQRLVPSAERVRFTASGTESTLLALRVARAFSGKQKIVRFAGHFHGWHDHMAFAVNSHFDGSVTPGVLPEVAQNILLAEANDLPALEQLLAQHDDVAAIIIEPTGASWGKCPVSEDFLRASRPLADRHGALLIFDEVISGFRVSPGGAQAHFGVKPDLTTMAKIVAGGLPGGALAGRRDVLDTLDFKAAKQSGKGKVPHQGTFNANPIAAAAGIATLRLVAETDACQRANEYAARLREALRGVIEEVGAPWVVYGSFSGFHIFTNPDRLPLSQAAIETGQVGHKVLKAANPATAAKLRLGMLLNGVEIFSWPGGPTSAVHTDEDLAITVEAFRKTLDLLKAEGDLD